MWTSDTSTSSSDEHISALTDTRKSQHGVSSPLRLSLAASRHGPGPNLLSITANLAYFQTKSGLQPSLARASLSESNVQLDCLIDEQIGLSGSCCFLASSSEISPMRASFLRLLQFYTQAFSSSLPRFLPFSLLPNTSAPQCQTIPYS